VELIAVHAQRHLDALGLLLPKALLKDEELIGKTIRLFTGVRSGLRSRRSLVVGFENGGPTVRSFEVEMSDSVWPPQHDMELAPKLWQIVPGQACE
jgi:hypothetical protein